jgi:hypothetical protein
MSNQKSFGLSIDVFEFVRQLMTDPTAAQQVLDAVKAETPESSKIPLGACNLGTMENREWYTPFIANSKDIEQGEAGYILRPNSEKTKGRIILNLKEQMKEQFATQTLADKMSTASAATQGPKQLLSEERRQKLLATLKRPREASAAPEVPAEALAALGE